MYFNNEINAVNFLIKYLLPFLNADYEINIKIEKMMQENSKSIKEMIFNYLQKEKLEQTLEKNKKDMAELFSLKETEVTKAFISLRNKCIDIHNRCIDDRFALIAKTNESHVSIPNKLVEYLDWLIKTPFRINNKNNANAIEFEEELQKYLNDSNKTRAICWKGVARCITYLASNSRYSYDEIIKKVCSDAVIECLWTVFDYSEFQIDDDYLMITPHDINKLFEDSENINEINRQFLNVSKAFETKNIYNYIRKGDGFNFIALCPICNRVFYKNRKDKEYCSLSCSKIGSMRKLREKSK